MIKRLFISVAVILLSFNLVSQVADAKGELDKPVIRIGEQSVFRMSVTAPEDAKVEWPLIGDTIVREIEILKKSPIDTTTSDGVSKYVEDITITSFDSGYYAIPPFEFKVKFSDGTERIIETEALLYEVHTVDIDTTADIKFIKPIADVPVKFSEVIPYIEWTLIIAAVVAGIFFLVRYLKKRKKQYGSFTRPKVVIPPHRAALDALYALEKEKLWQSGEVKEYYFRITSILREYISGQFGFEAVEMVTDDIFRELHRTGKCKQEDIDSAKQLFELSDLVKFAKHQPEAEEHGKTLEKAYDFVNSSYKYFMELKKQEEMKTAEEQRKSTETTEGGKNVQ